MEPLGGHVASPFGPAAQAELGWERAMGSAVRDFIDAEPTLSTVPKPIRKKGPSPRRSGIKNRCLLQIQ